MVNNTTLLTTILSAILLVLGLLYVSSYIFYPEILLHYLSVIAIFLLVPALVAIVVGCSLFIAGLYDLVEGNQ